MKSVANTLPCGASFIVGAPLGCTERPRLLPSLPHRRSRSRSPAGASGVSPGLQVALRPDHVVRLLQPTAKLAVQVVLRLDPHEVPAPAGPVVDRPENSWALQPPM